MNIHLVGLSHQTTPVELREQFNITGEALHSALLHLNAIVQEGVILSTCNRFEVVVADVADHMTLETYLIDFLCAHHKISADTLRTYLYSKSDETAAMHLMRVASGLDSMILGETQILGQMNTAFETAHDLGTTGTTLNRLFNVALHAGKRAHAETTISQQTLSVSHAAATLVRHEAGTQAKVLVIGAGEMAELAIVAAHSRGLEDVAIINRTYSHAQEMSEKHQTTVYEWNELWERLSEVDAVISATGAPHLVLYATDLARVIEKRVDKDPLVMVDIAVPRDIDPQAADMDGLKIFDIDDLQRTVDDTLTQRQACIPQVNAIIAEEVNGFTDWLNSRAIVPLITGLRRKVEDVVQNEVTDALQRLNHLDQSDQEVIQRLAHRIINKVLHEPTVSLREHAARGEAQEISKVVRDLFALEPESMTTEKISGEYR